MKKMSKYVVVREKKKNAKAAFDAYKNIVFQDGKIPQSIGDSSVPVVHKEEVRPSRSKSSAKYPDFYKPATGVGIVDIYQSESSNEDEGVNTLRVELTDGTYREFKVRNGSKGEEGCAGLGGIRGPRGATGAQGPKGDPGVSGVYLGSGDMPEGYNVQIDPDGEPVEIPKEEWITIADITTTEEANKFLFTTDMNGNPFKCKKIYAHGKLPSALGSIQGFVYSVNGTNNGIFTSIFGDAIFFEIVIELFANGAIKYDLSQSAAEMHYIGKDGAAWRIRPDGETIDAITYYAVECYTDLTIPIGTQIKVWGLKA